GRIDDVAFDPLFPKHAIDPESVETSLLDDDEREDLPRSRQRFLPKLRKALQEPGDIAATHSVLRHLLSAVWRQRCDPPSRSTQFQRDEYRAKISTDSVRCFGSVSYGLHGRLQSEWSQPHSARALVAIHFPMGS